MVTRRTSSINAGQFSPGESSDLTTFDNMKTSVLAASLASLLSVASAHTIFQELWVNGVSQGHMNGIRVPDYDGVRAKAFPILLFF